VAIEVFLDHPAIFPLLTGLLSATWSEVKAKGSAALTIEHKKTVELVLVK